MEKREVPAALTGNGIALPLYGPGMDTAVEVVNPATGAAFFKSFPGFRGEIVAAAADVNGDGVPDAIIGVQNSGGLIAVVDGASGNLLGSAFVFPGMTGRINVGAADLNGDGFADILVTASAPGAPVRAFDVHNGRSAGFNAFPGLNGQTSITGADLNGDGKDEILVGIGGPNLGGRVAAFDVFGHVVNPGGSVFPGFNGGISLAAGDVDGDGRDDIVIGAGPGSPGGEVKVISGTGAILADVLPFAPSVTKGVNVYVADGDRDGVGDVFVGLQGGGFPNLVGLRGLASGHLGTGFSGGACTYPVYDSSSAGDVLSSNGYVYIPDTSFTPPADPGFTQVDVGSPYDPSCDYVTASCDPGGTYDYSNPPADSPDYTG